jgi:hypothetical protein
VKHRALIAVGILLLSGCTANGPLVRAATSPSPTTVAPSPEAPPSPTPPPPAPIAPTVSCTTTPSASSEPLVMAMTPDRQKFQVHSFRDPIHPAALCTMSGASFRFISSTEVGYAITTSLWNQTAGARSAIARMSWTDLKPAVVVEAQGDVMDFAWSPDGSSLAYLLYTSASGIGTGAGNQLWLKTGDAPPRALTPLIPLFGRGGSISDQILVRFSRDGKYILMVDTFVGGPVPASPEYAHFQVLAMPAGNTVWVPPTALMAGDKIGYSFVTMAAWSRTADRLYYRDQAGVHTWDPPRTVGTMSAGLTWFSPSVSPDGRFLAYAVNMTDQPHVEVRDLVTNDVRVIRGARGAPFFVTNSQLFVAEYAPSTQQGPGVQAYSQTGRAFVIDLRTIVETTVPMINPIDYWPR